MPLSKLNYAQHTAVVLVIVVLAIDASPHTEGGGDQDVIAFFSNRNIGDLVYEVLDENLATIGTLGMADFRALFEAQEPTKSFAAE